MFQAKRSGSFSSIENIAVTVQDFASSGDVNFRRRYSYDAVPLDSSDAPDPSVNVSIAGQRDLAETWWPQAPKTVESHASAAPESGPLDKSFHDYLLSLSNHDKPRQQDTITAIKDDSQSVDALVGVSGHYLDKLSSRTTIDDSSKLLFTTSRDQLLDDAANSTNRNSNPHFNHLLTHSSQIFHEIFLTGSMPNYKAFLLSQFHDRHTFYSFLFLVDVVLRGIAQVFLCDHPISGLLICAGLAISSWNLLVFALLGTACGTLGAFLVGRPRESDLVDGLCGYDGALIGCSCYTFLSYDTDPARVVAIAVLLSFASGIVHVCCANVLSVFGLPTFTFAFNLVMMAFLMSVATGNATIVSLASSNGTAAKPDPSYTDMSAHYMLDASTRGVGQFMFVDTTVGSGLVILGIGVASRIAATAAWVGATVSCLVCYYLIAVPDLAGVRDGLFGYNSAGCCAAIAGAVFFTSTPGNYAVGCVGAALAALVLTAFKSIFGYLWKLPVLTFPFITSAWIILMTKSVYLEPKRQLQIDFDLVGSYRAARRWLAWCLGAPNVTSATLTPPATASTAVAEEDGDLKYL